MELEEMEQFVQVAKLIHRGETELPRNLLSYVRQLEMDYGARLLARSDEGEGLTLTCRGDELAAESMRSLRLASAAVDAARSLTRTGIGTLRIGFSEGAMGGHIQMLIRRFNEQRPHAPLELVDFTHEGLIDALEAGRLDVGFAIDGPLPVTIESLPLERQGFVAVMSPDHPSAHSDFLDIADLARLRTVEYCSIMNGVLAREVGELLMHSGGLGRIRVDGPRNAIIAAASGLGVALLPEGVANLVRHSTLKVLPLRPDDVGVDIVAMWRLGEDDPLVDALLGRDA